MDVGRSISYVFEDPDWIKKVLIGGLLSLIPVFGWFVVLGYWIRVAQNVSNGHDLPLPLWDDFGGDFIRGAKAWLAVMVWAIPLIILFLCGWIPFAVAGNRSGPVSALAALFGIGFYGIGSLLAIAIAFITPVIVGRVVGRDSVAAAFEFSQIVSEARSHVVPLLIIVGMTLVLRFVAGFGIILCGVGLLFTTFMSYVMLSHLYGQFWRSLGSIGSASTNTIVPGPTI